MVIVDPGGGSGPAPKPAPKPDPPASKAPDDGRGHSGGGSGDFKGTKNLPGGGGKFSDQTPGSDGQSKGEKAVKQDTGLIDGPSATPGDNGTPGQTPAPAPSQPYHSSLTDAINARMQQGMSDGMIGGMGAGPPALGPVPTATPVSGGVNGGDVDDPNDPNNKNKKKGIGAAGIALAGGGVGPTGPGPVPQPNSMQDANQGGANGMAGGPPPENNAPRQPVVAPNSGGPGAPAGQSDPHAHDQIEKVLPKISGGQGRFGQGIATGPPQPGDSTLTTVPDDHTSATTAAVLAGVAGAGVGAAVKGALSGHYGGKGSGDTPSPADASKAAKDVPGDAQPNLNSAQLGGASAKAAQEAKGAPADAAPVVPNGGGANGYAKGAAEDANPVARPGDKFMANEDGHATVKLSGGPDNTSAPNPGSAAKAAQEAKGGNVPGQGGEGSQWYGRQSWFNQGNSVDSPKAPAEVPKAGPPGGSGDFAGSATDFNSVAQSGEAAASRGGTFSDAVGSAAEGAPSKLATASKFLGRASLVAQGATLAHDMYTGKDSSASAMYRSNHPFTMQDMTNAGFKYDPNARNADKADKQPDAPKQDAGPAPAPGSSVIDKLNPPPGTPGIPGYTPGATPAPAAPPQPKQAPAPAPSPGSGGTGDGPQAANQHGGGDALGAATPDPSMRDVKAPKADYQHMLSEGDSGPRVKQLQESLNTGNSNIKVDGKFGPDTDRAVRDYQASSKNLAVDGIYGPHSSASSQKSYNNRPMVTTTSPEEAPPANRPAGAAYGSGGNLGDYNTSNGNGMKVLPQGQQGFIPPSQGGPPGGFTQNRGPQGLTRLQNGASSGAQGSMPGSVPQPTGNSDSSSPGQFDTDGYQGGDGYDNSQRNQQRRRMLSGPQFGN